MMKPLSYATCRFPSSSSFINNDLAPFVLIEDEEGVWLCRLCSSSSSLDDTRTNNQQINGCCCYSRSIQVTGYTHKMNEQEDQQFDDRMESRRIRIVPENETDYPSPTPTEACPYSAATESSTSADEDEYESSNRRHHSHFIVDDMPPFADDDRINHGTMAFLSQSSLPIVSLSIQVVRRRMDNDERDDDSGLPDDDKYNASSPLFIACIKRQFIGCPILWSSTIRTVLRVSIPSITSNAATTTTMEYDCHVQSVPIVITPSSTTRTESTTTLGIIHPSTRITVHVDSSPPPPRLPPLSTSTSSKAEQLLRETVHCLQLKQSHVPRYFLWTGPPGVGKTHTVQQMMPYCHVQNFPGASAFAADAIMPAIPRNSNKPTLFFFDEIDALTEQDTATLALWLDEWTLMSNIIVVAATNRIETLPAFLRRRFHCEMQFVPPTAVERAGMLQHLFHEWWPDIIMTKHALEEDLHEVADLCVGYVAADLAALVRQAALTHILDRETTTCSMKDSLLRAMQHVGASALRDSATALSMTTNTTTGWDDIAGDAGGAKKALRQAIEWPRTKQKAYALLGLTPPRGILLHGPPGCAKTSLARAAAGAAGVAFVSLAPADVYASSYVGDAEAVVRRSFDLARSAAPCVLFFDEIDAILGVMSEDSGVDGGMARGHSAEARVLSTFLNEMDGVDGSWKDGVLVLGATNRPWTLDAALLRPGRFDKIIYVPPPDKEGRRSILEMQTRHWRKEKDCHEKGNTNDDPIDIDYLASDEISGNMTGAEIKGACQEAAMNALREYSMGNTSAAVVHQKDLLQSFSSIKPLLSDPRQMERFYSFENQRQNCS